MPNYCWNTLKMDGVGRKYTSETFSFQAIIPMPESLNIEAGSREGIAVLYYLSCRFTVAREGMSEEDQKIFDRYLEHGKKISYEKIKEKYRDIYKEKDYEELYTLGSQYVYNLKNYGHPHWYSWCYDKWSTKWNPWDVDVCDDDTITFTTAWGPPENVIKRLSELTPEKIVTCIWAEESGYEGWFCYLNGECIKEVDRERYYCEEDNEYIEDDTSLYDDAEIFAESVNRNTGCLS